MLDNDDIIDMTKRSLEEYPLAHRQVLTKASRLAQQAVRLCPPFDRVRNTTLWQRTCLSALEGIDSTEKEGILEAMIATARGNMCGESFRDEEMFRRLYDFEDKMRASGVRLFKAADRPVRDRNLHEPPIIIDIMKHRYSDFYRDNKALELFGKVKSKVLCFSKLFVKSSKILIIIRTAGVRLEATIGISCPYFSIDVGSPWATSGSWSYWDERSCEQAINNALDVVDIVIAPFEKKMSEALE